MRVGNHLYKLRDECVCFFSYGDRRPKTVGGKIFSVVWTLTGQVVILILTSLIAGHLTTYSLKIDRSLYGKQVRNYLYDESVINSSSALSTLLTVLYLFVAKKWTTFRFVSWKMIKIGRAEVTKNTPLLINEKSTLILKHFYCSKTCFVAIKFQVFLVGFELLVLP
jgi:hypothetical protein